MDEADEYIKPAHGHTTEVIDNWLVMNQWK